MYELGTDKPELSVKDLKVILHFGMVIWEAPGRFWDCVTPRKETSAYIWHLNIQQEFPHRV